MTDAQVEEIKRHFGAVAETFRSDIHSIAEKDSGIGHELQTTRNELQDEFKAMRACIRLAIETSPVQLLAAIHYIRSRMARAGSRNWRLALPILAFILVSGCMTTPEEKLREAAADGNALRVQTLLEQGVTAQAADERGITPLHLAAKNGHRNVMILLLEHGAAINPARQDGVTPLFAAVQEGRRDVVALLLENGADVNAHARIGAVTPLHIGAYKGDQKMIAFLVEHGADKNARMTSGERPVDLAQAQGHTALIPLLEP